MTESTVFAHALLQLDGVGRVTTHRLLAAFPTYEALRQTPREQVLVRLKKAPRAGETVHTLFDDAAMLPLLAQARTALETLAARHIHVIAPGGQEWPGQLDALDRAHRPVLLYTYGMASLLQQPLAALLNRPPISRAAFDMAEDFARFAKQRGLLLATGLATGFDKVINQLSAAPPRFQPTAMVLNGGLATVDKSLRPVASGMVKQGSVLCSPFPLHHGPFDHDDHERVRLQVALACASVFFDPRPDTPEWRAMGWACEAARPVFVAGAVEASLPEGVVLLASAEDFERVLRAVQPGEAA